jgi:hypothetical protein
LRRRETDIMNNQRLQSKPEEAQSGAASNDNSQPSSAGRLLKGLPWAWLALSGFVTLLWPIGIGWVAVKLFQWLAD